MQEPNDVFNREVQTLKEAKAVLKKKTNSLEELKEAYKTLSQDYESLLGDARVITNISDRLQNRLNITNDKLHLTNDKLNDANLELKRSAEEIQGKNELLQSTIDELTKAKIGRKTTTIVLMAAVLLFLISEVFLEPIVDKYFQQDFFYNIGIKLSIALLLKPIDYLVEWVLMKDTMRKSKQV